MKVLELNLYLFNSLGLWTDETTNRAVQVSKFAFWLWGVFYCASGCSGVYLYHHYNEVIPATNALIVFTGGMAGSASLISFGLKLKEIKLIYATLQSLVDAAEKHDAFEFYKDAERKTRRLTKLLTAFMLGNITIAVYAAVYINAGYQIFVLKNHNATDWYLPFNTIDGIDRSTILGFFCKCPLQMLIGYSYLLTMSCVCSFFGGCCYYINAGTLEFKQIFEHMDAALAANDQTLIRQMGFHTKRAVIFHIKIMELFDALEGVMSGTIFTQLLSNVIFFSSSMYQVETTIKDISIAYSVFCFCQGVTWMLSLCYYATHATESLGNVGEHVYGSNWYSYPVSLRKFLLLLIAETQQEKLFTGFKIVGCTLMTFTSLTRAATSYYIMFRNMSMNKS